MRAKTLPFLPQKFGYGIKRKHHFSSRRINEKLLSYFMKVIVIPRVRTVVFRTVVVSNGGVSYTNLTLILFCNRASYPRW